MASERFSHRPPVFRGRVVLRRPSLSKAGRVYPHSFTVRLSNAMRRIFRRLAEEEAAVKAAVMQRVLWRRITTEDGQLLYQTPNPSGPKE